MKNKQYTCILTIAGTDPSGGAGVQADLKTFSALGCYGMSVITAVVAQNTQIVQHIHEISPTSIAKQLQAVFEDIRVDAIKIGMLFNKTTIDTVADCLENLKTHFLPPIVVDPVMVAKGGSKLLLPEAQNTLIKRIFPLATIVTPNLPEASSIVEKSLQTDAEIERAAKTITQMGPPSVVIKGGHSSGTLSRDCLYFKSINTHEWLEGERIPTKNTHGTGCSFSSAIAAYLGHGNDTPSAVKHAKAYITEAIKAGAHYKIGHGHGPVHHFYQHWS